jgi:hypothetical protein
MRKTILERFLDKVRKDPTTGCWIWTAAHNDKGRAIFEGISASKMAYIIFRGPTKGLNVLHDCNNLSCVNPEHVRLGTQQENIQQAHRQGRVNQRGSRNNNSKLSDEDVRAIRVSDEPQYVLAARHNVSQQLISLIKTGKVRRTKTDLALSGSQLEKSDKT